MARTLFLVIVAWAASLSPLWAQPARHIDNVRPHLEAYLQQPDAAEGREALEEAVNEALQAAVMQRLYHMDVIETAERLRFDKQAGGSANAGGGTSLVASAVTGGLFTAAFESGALQRTTDGTVATFRLNALRAYRLLTNTRPDSCALLFRWCRADEARSWSGLSFALSLDASQQDRASAGDNGEATLLRAGRAVSAVSVRYELLRRRAYDEANYQSRWESAVENLAAGDRATALATAMAQTVGLLLERDDYQTFRADLVVQLLHAPRRLEDLAALLWRHVDAYVDDWIHAEPEGGTASNADRLLRAAQALQLYRQARNEALRDALFGSALTVEYTFQRPTDQPEFSNLKVIAGFPLGAWHDADRAGTVPAAELTVNVGANFYHTRPEGTSAGYLRDAQLALQLDRRLFEWRSIGQPVLSLAGYYQYMFEAGVIEFDREERAPGTPIPLPRPAVELLNTKGAIGIVQVKLSFPLGDSGVTMPVGLTWATRTELIKASEVRGQFGFTFDLDRLLAQQ